MRKAISVIALAMLFLSMIPGVTWSGYRFSQNLLATATTLGAGASKVNGVGFTSTEINLIQQPSLGALTVTFARAAGAADVVTFYFEVSADGGTTWSTFEGTNIAVATNHDVISGTTVRSTWIVELGGISHIRLAKIVNGDAANALTAVNVKVSF